MVGLRGVEGQARSPKSYGDAGEVIFPRVATGKSHDDPPHAGLHERPEAEQTQSDRVGLGVGEVGADEGGAADVLDQDVRGGEQDAELNGAKSWQLVRSAKRSRCCSLKRFSLSPR